MIAKTIVPVRKGDKLQYVNPYDYYGLSNIPHRRVNHDPVTAGIMSFLEHGYDGIGLANTHLALDMISESIKKQLGVTGRDLFEAELNYVLENMIKRRGHRIKY